MLRIGGVNHLNRLLKLNCRVVQSCIFKLALPAKQFLVIRKLIKHLSLQHKFDNSQFKSYCWYLVLRYCNTSRVSNEYYLIKESFTAVMNLPGFEVAYFLPCHGFADQMSINSSVEGNLVCYNFWLQHNYFKQGFCPSKTMKSSRNREANFTHSLKRIRTEEFIGNGFKKKQECLQKDKQVCIKVMSYNVLSQTLLENHRHLYININPSVLQWNFRFPRILGQISSEDPDILCLQEIQESHFNNFTASLTELGYRGLFKKKTGNKTDGCAIYYKSRSFSLVNTAFVEFFRPNVSVLNRDNVGLILRLNLREFPEEDLVVGTTHLLFNPKRHDVRLAQTQLFLAEIQRIANLNDKKCTVIFTGDLNSFPDSLIVKLISDGSVQHFYPPLPAKVGVLPTCKFADPDSVEIYYSDNFGYETMKKYNNAEVSPGRRSTNESFNLSHDFNFQSVYPFLENNYPVATTFQNRWVTVDYMFYSCCEKLELLSRLRLPTSAECSKDIKYLPNYASPSDHLPLVATFAFTAD